MTMRTLTDTELATLLDELRLRVSARGSGQGGARCLGDLTTTRRILESMQKTAAEIRWIVAELREGGGYCDCEVLLNVGSHDEADDDPA